MVQDWPFKSPKAWFSGPAKDHLFKIELVFCWHLLCREQAYPKKTIFKSTKLVRNMMANMRHHIKGMKRGLKPLSKIIPGLWRCFWRNVSFRGCLWRVHPTLSLSQSHAREGDCEPGRVPQSKLPKFTNFWSGFLFVTTKSWVGVRVAVEKNTTKPEKKAVVQFCCQVEVPWQKTVDHSPNLVSESLSHPGYSEA